MSVSLKYPLKHARHNHRAWPKVAAPGFWEAARWNPGHSLRYVWNMLTRPDPIGPAPRPALAPAMLTQLAQLAASDSPAALAAIAAQACALTNAQLALLGSYNWQSGEVHVQAAYGTTTARWLGMRLSWPALATAGFEAIQSEHAMQDTRFAPLQSVLQDMQLGSAMLLPVQTQNSTIGLLVLAGQPAIFDTAALECAQLLAALAAGALVQGQLRTQAGQAAQARTTILDTISHEFRTPITVILGYAELYREGLLGPVSSRQHEALEAIHRNTGRLLKLVENLLDLARIETGEMELVPGPVNLTVCLHKALERSEATLASDCDAAAIAELPPVWGDALWLRRALTELFVFAREIVPGCALHLSSTIDSEPSQVRLAVTVPGLASAGHSALAIFETTAEAQARLGLHARLSLNLSKHAIAALGGTLTVEQHGNYGCFTIALRAAPYVNEVHA